MVKNDQQIIQSEVRLHDVTSGGLRQTLAVNTEAISTIAFAQNGQQLLIGGIQREQQRHFATLELLDIHNGSQGSLLSNDEGTESSVVVSPNGNAVAFQTDASTVNLVDTQTWKIKHTFTETSDASSANASLGRFMLSVKSVMALAFSSDGRMVSGEIEQGGIKQWDIRTGEVKKQFADDGGTGSIVGMSSNGIMVAAVDSDETLRLWNLASREEKIFTEKGGSVSAIALSADGQTLAISYSERIVLMNTARLELIGTFERARVSCLTFSSDGRRLAAGDTDGRLEIWDLNGAQVSGKMQSAGKVTALSFSPAGETLVSAGPDGSVSFWDSRTGTLNRHVKKHSGPVNAIAFSPKGDLMATGGDDRTVTVWETATGKSQRTLKGHDLAVTSLAFSPDASLLASGTGNASVVLWEVRSGNLIRILR